MPNEDCDTCRIKSQLIMAEWTHRTATTAANVHALANRMMLVVGALEFVRLGRGECRRCLKALQAPLRDEANDGINS